MTDEKCHYFLRFKSEMGTKQNNSHLDYLSNSKGFHITTRRVSTTTTRTTTKRRATVMFFEAKNRLDY